ncbi:MAG TPA: hypothetical protein VLV76_25725 [Candidatus Acidoferrum sp.]|nr:hypothetical protein [Candidatus Acidoferrum sp.]
MIAILAAMALVFALVFGFAGSSQAVQVTFFGSGLPTPDPSNFEDCGPTTFGSKPVNDDCYAYLKPGNNDPLECTYTVGFRARDVHVARLRVRVALMRDGKVIGRDSIQINSLDRPSDDPYVTKSFRAACDAKQLRVLEARAYIAGQETDLIATDSIGSKGLMPFFPDFFIKIGQDSES